MGKKKKSYTAEFKARVALDCIRGDLTINEISTKYGVHSSQINRWKQQARTAIKTGFISNPEKLEQGDGKLLEKLYGQIGKLKVENDFLKKSVWE